MESPIARVYVYGALGNVEQVLSAFEAVEDWGYVSTVLLRYSTMQEGMMPEGLSQIRGTPRYEALIERVNEAWGLSPDGSLPKEIDVPASQTER